MSNSENTNSDDGARLSDAVRSISISPVNALHIAAKFVQRVLLPTWPAFDAVEGSSRIVGPRRQESSSLESSSFKNPLRSLGSTGGRGCWSCVL